MGLAWACRRIACENRQLTRPEEPRASCISPKTTGTGRKWEKSLEYAKCGPEKMKSGSFQTERLTHDGGATARETLKLYHSRFTCNYNYSLPSLSQLNQTTPKITKSYFRCTQIRSSFLKGRPGADPGPTQIRFYQADKVDVQYLRKKARVSMSPLPKGPENDSGESLKLPQRLMVYTTRIDGIFIRVDNKLSKRYR